MCQRLAVSLLVVLATGTVGFGPVAALRAAALQTRREDESASRLLKLRSWATAVREHEPGRFDPAASVINAWSPSDLQGLVSDLRARLRTLAGAARRGQSARAAELQQLLGLTDEELLHGDASRILKRGALLHADIAILAPHNVQPVTTTSLSGSPGVVFVYSDGRLQGVALSGVHWEVGRSLLAEIRPNPSADETVRLWYRATSAYLQTHHAFVYAEPHLKQARRMFPADADILLYSGSVHETYAAPATQATVGPGTTTERRLRGDFGGLMYRPILPASVVRSAGEELQQAESFFRQALKSAPDLTEPRIRLGRVLEQLEHPQEAVTELRQAAAGTQNELLEYYANLFLGQAEQALGHREAARDAFQRAAMLYPRAQSPRLALSQLARRSGDRSGALGAIQEVLTLPSDETKREDPWWRYNDTHVPDADTLLEELRKRFRSEEPQ